MLQRKHLQVSSPQDRRFQTVHNSMLDFRECKIWSKSLAIQYCSDITLESIFWGDIQERKGDNEFQDQLLWWKEAYERKEAGRTCCSRGRLRSQDSRKRHGSCSYLSSCRPRVSLRSCAGARQCWWPQPESGQQCCNLRRVQQEVSILVNIAHSLRTE